MAGPTGHLPPGKGLTECQRQPGLHGLPVPPAAPPPRRPALQRAQPALQPAAGSGAPSGLQALPCFLPPFSNRLFSSLCPASSSTHLPLLVVLIQKVKRSGTALPSKSVARSSWKVRAASRGMYCSAWYCSMGTGAGTCNGCGRG